MECIDGEDEVDCHFNLLVWAVLAALLITGLTTFFAKAIQLKVKDKEWIDLEIRDIDLNHFCQDVLSLLSGLPNNFGIKYMDIMVLFIKQKYSQNIKLQQTHLRGILDKGVYSNTSLFRHKVK